MNKTIATQVGSMNQKKVLCFTYAALSEIIMLKLVGSLKILDASKITASSLAN